MKKRGQYFILEAFVGLVILGLALTFLFYVYQDPKYPELNTKYLEASDVAVLFDTQISEISSGLCSYDGDLVNNSNITNIEYTFIEQMGEFYYRNQTKNCSFCLDLAYECVLDFASMKGIDSYSFELNIDNTTLYNQTVFLNQSEANLLIPIHFVVFGLQDNQDYWGPYQGEIKIWR